jgi:hypothetical protein
MERRIWRNRIFDSDATLRYKVKMDPDSAAERLQVIRTLMERSAIYRRALAPIMIYIGVLGLVASVLGSIARIDRALTFSLYWAVVSVLALLGAYVFARRQALRDKEEFWSPPTRRVTQALLPSLFAGAVIGAIFTFSLGNQASFSWALPVTWILIYGCAMHAAGFFMPRGFKLFGWLFIMGGTSLCLSSLAVSVQIPYASSHLIMGVFFGGLHLAYGVYLVMTGDPEKRA